ncbi:heavy-metal-associated domain-containing protein [Elioraea sp.]|uniref:heavy-metal-associated domain-containing protein n=1 Tax=Elioraea sp. TaxID=2185103 RepID=UPI0025C34B27|nr:heavy-metal-associated domain-containing protein [Elioraea sp.]
MVIKVGGMTCGGCAAAVKRAIEGTVPGAAATVSLERGEVEVTGVDVAAAKAAIVAAGFEVAGFEVGG